MWINRKLMIIVNIIIMYQVPYQYIVPSLFFTNFYLDLLLFFISCFFFFKTSSVYRYSAIYQETRNSDFQFKGSFELGIKPLWLNKCSHDLWTASLSFLILALQALVFVPSRLHFHPNFFSCWPPSLAPLSPTWGAPHCLNSSQYSSCTFFSPSTSPICFKLFICPGY